jgi:hypothetical protein
MQADYWKYNYTTYTTPDMEPTHILVLLPCISLNIHHIENFLKQKLYIRIGFVFY